MKKWVGGALLLVCAVAIAFVGTRSQDATGERALVDAAESCPPRETEFVAHYECLGEVLVDVMARGGVEAGVSSMGEMVADDPLRASACHQAAHYAARKSSTVEKVREILAGEDGTCDFGLTHGALESLSEIEDGSRFESVITTVCEAAGDGIRRYNCAHGIGHALALRGERKIGGLVQRCGTLAQQDQEGCVTAAAMVYQSNKSSFSEDIAVEMERLTNEELAGVCESVRGAAAATCWQMLATMMDWSDAGKVAVEIEGLCARATTQGHGDGCASGYGQGVYFHLDDAGDLDPDQIEENFTAAVANCPDGGMRNACIAGISGGIASFWSAERNSFEAYPDLCGRFEGELRERCLEPENLWRTTLAGLDRDR